jgi:hypothetical protein
MLIKINFVFADWVILQMMYTNICCFYRGLFIYQWKSAIREAHFARQEHLSAKHNYAHQIFDSI